MRAGMRRRYTAAREEQGKDIENALRIGSEPLGSKNSSFADTHLPSSPEGAVLKYLVDRHSRSIEEESLMHGKRSHLLVFAIALSLLGITLLASPTAAFASEAVATQDGDLSKEMKRISEEYDVGDYLSSEDAEIVRAYFARPATRNSGTINIQANKYGVSVSAYGTVYYENTSLLGRAYGADANVVVNSGATPKSMELVVHCTAYGVGADGALFVVHDGTTSTGRVYGRRSFSTSPRGVFSGVTVFANVTTTLNVVTSSGDSFTVESS